MVNDLIAETQRRIDLHKPDTVQDIRNLKVPVAAFSPEMQKKLNELRAFLGDRMYRHHPFIRMTSKARRVVKDLFDIFMAEPETLPTEWQSLLSADVDDMQKSRLIADYIAGMTDNYAMLEHKRLFDLYIQH